jgi:hypothetical protein
VGWGTLVWVFHGIAYPCREWCTDYQKLLKKKKQVICPSKKDRLCYFYFYLKSSTIKNSFLCQFHLLMVLNFIGR